MTKVFPAISPQTYLPHPLHGPDRAWSETNCYADMWIEVLAAFGVPPESMLGFTLTQDFEGDQFTFFKPPAEDLEQLYGIINTELAIFDCLETHVAVQIERGRLCQVEADSFHLPDTKGVTYGIEHGKTTIAINRIDPAGKSLDYFHNAGFFELSGADYEGVFQHHAELNRRWIPYTDFAKFTAPPATEAVLREKALGLLSHHLARRPLANPLASFAEVFPAQVERVAQRPFGFFYLYAFNTLRQFGANFELLAAHLAWLDPGHFADETAAAQLIADNAKTTQFMLARAVTRRRFEPLTAALAPSISAWDEIMAALSAKVG